MQASSWRLSEQLDYDPAWIDGNRFRQWIEGNIVVAPDQSLVNVLRVDEHTCGRSAAIVRVLSPGTARVRSPQGHRRKCRAAARSSPSATIRCRSSYWSLTSVVRRRIPGPRPRGDLCRRHPLRTDPQHPGAHQFGGPPPLGCRTDRHPSDNPFFDGFQYIDWQFDGDDLIAVIRLAVEEPAAFRNRQHDAKFLVFKRIERFRKPGAPFRQRRTLHKTLKQTDTKTQHPKSASSSRDSACWAPSPRRRNRFLRLPAITATIWSLQEKTTVQAARLGRSNATLTVTPSGAKP